LYFCYLDESGTPDKPGNTSHYVLAGVSIPVKYWKACDRQIEIIKSKYDLVDDEIHVAWLLRSYPEQNKIANFDSLSYIQRRMQVTAFRAAELLRLQRANNPDSYHRTKKTYRKTEKYIHLTKKDRQKLIYQIATAVSRWSFARLFAECIDKVYFDPIRNNNTIEGQSFEQVVSRFEHYLQATAQYTSAKDVSTENRGLLIHDNNETVSKKHTDLMKKYHKDGTLWISLKSIIETPLFVDSELTGMVQIADLCAYALRRYLENNESDLFDLIFKRADRIGDVASPVVVGVRHFTSKTCACKICTAHRHA